MSQLALEKQKELMSQELEILKRQYVSGWRNYNRQLGHLRDERVNFTTDPKFISIDEFHVNKVDIQHEIKVHNDAESMMAHRRNTGPRTLLRHAVLKKRQQIFETSNANRYSRNTTPLMGAVETKEERKLRIRRRRRAVPQVCSFGMATHERCKDIVVPLTKFCFKHVTQVCVYDNILIMSNNLLICLYIFSLFAGQVSKTSCSMQFSSWS
jgi:hypothetical protein